MEKNHDGILLNQLPKEMKLLIEMIEEKMVEIEIGIEMGMEDKKEVEVNHREEGINKNGEIGNKIFYIL